MMLDHGVITENIKVYVVRKRGRLHYQVQMGSRTILTTTRHDVAHE